MDTLGGKNVLILGLGVSGLAAARLAHGHGAQVTVLDSSAGDSQLFRAEQLRSQGIHVELGWAYHAFGGLVDLAVISPGIAPESILGKLASSLSCQVISELEFGFRFCECPILAVTGTNGKTTTVELTTHCLRHAGQSVTAAGNVGVPLSEVAPQSGELDCIVVEVSSFQLEAIAEFKPLAAACLNITSDHTDRHGNFGNYLQTKLRLFENMTDASKIVVSQRVVDLPEFHEYMLFEPGPVTFASGRVGQGIDYMVDESGWLCHRSEDSYERLLHRTDLQLVGNHNIENVFAALALCRMAGVAHSQAVQAIRRFAPCDHRLELVAECNGVRYFNDSKATNPDAVVQAIKACVQPSSGGRRIMLIAGGRDKQMDFEPVLPLLDRHVHEAFLLGESQDHLARVWDPVVKCTKVQSLDAAVEAAVLAAGEGDIVLLSPGCASQDMFENYADRGTQFKKALKRRLGQ